MQSLVVFALLFGCAMANPSYAPHYAPQYAAVPVVSHAKVGAIAHTPIHTVQKVHHTVHPVSIPVHHPPVTTVHQAPTAVLAQAPKISGYAYTSEVRHDAPLATKVVAHAPAYAAAPVVAHAPAYAAAPAYAHAPALHAAPAYAAPAYAAPAYAPAAHVSSVSVAAAPALIKETPAVSSYSLQTGRIETASQAHYATAHIPTVTKVGYAAPALYAAPAVAKYAPSHY